MILLHPCPHATAFPVPIPLLPPFSKTEFGGRSLVWAGDRQARLWSSSSKTCCQSSRSALVNQIPFFPVRAGAGR